MFVYVFDCSFLIDLGEVFTFCFTTVMYKFERPFGHAEERWKNDLPQLDSSEFISNITNVKL